MKKFFRKIQTPVGELTLIAYEHALIAVLWENDERYPELLSDTQPSANHPILDQTEKQLREYFRGERSRFEISIELQGTEFQKNVWQSLTEIPFGKTKTYKEVAVTLGSPKAFRAVGAANGKNPLSIILPCHRVVGTGGKLVGFAGGLAAKTILLKHENAELQLTL